MRTASDLHPHGCTCEDVCQPWRAHDARRISNADAISMAVVAAIVVGLLLCAAIDAITGWHGLLAMCGGVA